MLSNDACISEQIRLKHPVSIASISQRRMICGVGINDADYIIKPSNSGDQLFCQAYESWRGMIRRCFDKKFHVRFPTYSKCTVSDEWKSFMSFRVWWLENHNDGWRMDKDLLFLGNKHYSKETSIYIPEWLNNFPLGTKKFRGLHPVGVSLHKPSGLYVSSINNPFTGLKELLGGYKCSEKAHLSWKLRKLEFAYQLKSRMDSIDARIYPNVILMIEGKA